MVCLLESGLAGASCHLSPFRCCYLFLEVLVQDFGSDACFLLLSLGVELVGHFLWEHLQSFAFRGVELANCHLECTSFSLSPPLVSFDSFRGFGCSFATG